MRFVIHEHQTQDAPVHWDLMLEQGDVLKTYRLNRAPEAMLTHPCLAVPIFDHHTRFLQYEGPVQKGLGQVKRVDSGTYESVAMTERTWTVDLEGTLLQARVQLPLHKEGLLVTPNI
jgi:hypothetical protein